MPYVSTAEMLVSVPFLCMVGVSDKVLCVRIIGVVQGESWDTWTCLSAIDS